MANLQVGDLIPIGAVGNALARHVLTPFTFSSETEGTDIKGTMANNGSVNRTITTHNGQVNLSAGYYENIVIKAIYTNFLARYLQKGITIGGTVGTLLSVENIEIEIITIDKWGLSASAVFNGYSTYDYLDEVVVIPLVQPSYSDKVYPRVLKPSSSEIMIHEGSSSQYHTYAKIASWSNNKIEITLNRKTTSVVQYNAVCIAFKYRK